MAATEKLIAELLARSARDSERRMRLAERLLTLRERRAAASRRLELSESELKIVRTIGKGHLAGPQIARLLELDLEPGNRTPGPLQNQLSTMRRHGILVNDERGYSVAEEFEWLLDDDEDELPELADDEAESRATLAPPPPTKRGARKPL